MHNKKPRIDISDFFYLVGFAGFSYGIYEKYGLSSALIVSGAMFIVAGFLANKRG